jgi:hypothetical protein
LNGSVALMSPAVIFRSAWTPARKCTEAPALAIVVDTPSVPMLTLFEVL